MAKAETDIDVKIKEVVQKEVKQERKIAEERLSNMLRKARDRFEEEISAATADTRKEDQRQSMNKMTELMKQHEEQVHKLKLEAEISEKVVSKSWIFSF